MISPGSLQNVISFFLQKNPAPGSAQLHHPYLLQTCYRGTHGVVGIGTFAADLSAAGPLLGVLGDLGARGIRVEIGAMEAPLVVQ